MCARKNTCVDIFCRCLQGELIEINVRLFRSGIISITDLFPHSHICTHIISYFRFTCSMVLHHYVRMWDVPSRFLYKISFLVRSNLHRFPCPSARPYVCMSVCPIWELARSVPIAPWSNFFPKETPKTIFIVR